MQSASDPAPRRAEPYYPHGFLGDAAMRAYLSLAARRIDAGYPLPTMPLPPAETFCSAWAGIGAHVVLWQLATGTVPDRIWRRFVRSTVCTATGDFFCGFAGALPALAIAGASRGGAAIDLARVAHDRVRHRLVGSLAALERGGPIQLGLAHGLAGTLLGFEIGAALLGVDDRPLRWRAIEQLLRTAVDGPAGTTWPVAANTAQPVWRHAICNGGPGICLGALLGFRYSRDEAYGDLVARALAAVPVRSPVETLCCGTIGCVEVLIEGYRTTGDGRLLAVARELFATTDPARMAGHGWKDGPLGHAFTALRLRSPSLIDLPGLPMQIEPLTGGLAG